MFPTVPPRECLPYQADVLKQVPTVEVSHFLGGGFTPETLQKTDPIRRAYFSDGC